ncbi:MAG TPA: hypothetical protein VGN07_06655 [Steroidobacteraceae bacterium]
MVSRQARCASNRNDKLFDGGAAYDPASDTFGSASALDYDAIEDWFASVAVWDNKVDAARFLIGIIDDIIGIGNLSSPAYDDLEAILPFGLTIEALTNVQVASGNLTGGAQDDLLIGYSGNQPLTGNAEDEVFIGYGGQDAM